MAINDTLLKAICWTLVHSIWQGLLLALLAGAVILFTRRSSASLRYQLLSALFVGFVCTTGITFNYELKWERLEVLQQLNLPFAADSRMAQPFSITEIAIEFLNVHASQVVLVWFLVLSVKMFHISVSFNHIYRLRHFGTREPTAYWKRRLALLGVQVDIKRQIILLESKLVKVPSVTGYFKPIILIPIGLLSNLPQAQVEAILLHELAHIKRKDYFINILQSLAETVFFFNPGVLWLSSLLKEERENCCDDIAISVIENKVQFVHALVSFEEYNRHSSNLALGFGGTKNHLLNRARRIIHSSNKPLNGMEKTFLSVSLLFIGAIMLVCSNAKPLNENATNTAQPQLFPAAPYVWETQAVTCTATVNYGVKTAAETDELAKNTDKEAVTKDKLAAGQALLFGNPACEIKEPEPMDADENDESAPQKEIHSTTIRTVTSKTRKEHSFESQTVSYNGTKPKLNEKNVTLRTGISGENLPENINVAQLTNSIISELISKKIISSVNELSYKLSNNGLIVNGIVQPDSKFREIKEKFLKRDVHVICYNYVVSGVINL